MSWARAERGQEQRDKNKEGARAEKEGNLWAFRGCDYGLSREEGLRPSLTNKNRGVLDKHKINKGQEKEECRGKGGFTKRKETGK